IVDADEHATTVIKRTLGMPARALKNKWTDKILEMEQSGGDYEDLKDYISGNANKQFIHEGDMEKGFGWAGQGSLRIQDVPSVNELFQRILKDAGQVCKKWNNRGL